MGTSEDPAGPKRGRPGDAAGPLLFSIAYRVLGSVADAEDVLQEAFVRWQRTSSDTEEVRCPRAYLSSVVAQLCMDRLPAAKARREEYVGPSLPDHSLRDQRPT